MEATIGDQICIHGSIVGHPDKHGEIMEVREPAASRHTWCALPTGRRGSCSPAETRSSFHNSGPTRKADRQGARTVTAVPPLSPGRHHAPSVSSSQS